VSLTDDKPRFMEFLADNGFAEFAPEVYRDDVAYPFIYKKRIDIAGKNSHVIASAKDRAQFESGIPNEEYFKQEYVGGRTEYTTHLLAVKGESTFDSTMEFVFDRDAYVRGVRCEPAETRKVETPFVDVFQAILKALNYSGTACFNYKIADGVPKIFELNARAGGSLRLDLNAYVDAYIAALEARHSFASLWVHRLRRRFSHLSPPRDGSPAPSPPVQTQPA